MISWVHIYVCMCECRYACVMPGWHQESSLIVPHIIPVTPGSKPWWSPSQAYWAVCFWFGRNKRKSKCLGWWSPFREKEEWKGGKEESWSAPDAESLKCTYLRRPVGPGVMGKEESNRNLYKVHAKSPHAEEDHVLSLGGQKRGTHGDLDKHTNI